MTMAEQLQYQALLIKEKKEAQRKVSEEKKKVNAFIDTFYDSPKKPKKLRVQTEE